MYTKIDALLWKDPKFKKLDTQTKMLFIYLLTCPHRNITGLFYCPIQYMMADLNETVIETVAERLSELSKKGLITLDEDTETIFLNNYLDYNPIENPNQATAAMKALKVLPKTPLIINLFNKLNLFSKAYLDQLKSVIENSKNLKELKGLHEGLEERYAKQVTVDVEVKEDVTVTEKVEEEVSEKEKENLSLSSNALSLNEERRKKDAEIDKHFGVSNGNV